MSRIYITASMQHSTFGVAMPVLSIDTTDHLGGGFSVGGLHPASIAKMAGKLPEVKRGEMFDFKFNINAKRSSIALVVATNKHLPHLEWSSENGMGKLPMGVGTLASMLLMGRKETTKGSSKSKPAERSHPRRRDNSGHYQQYQELPREKSSHGSRGSLSRDISNSKSRHKSGRESGVGRPHRSAAIEIEPRRVRQASSRDSDNGRSHHSSRSRSNRDGPRDDVDSGYGSSEKHKRHYVQDSRSRRRDSRSR